ncbi:RNA recognition motif domain-containing protein [Prosthecobacter vanneervenii]|uniref:RNA recognition motif-containing protein n=1 Tax=Prosthecobacter vanneervenii TaxID=48466 RepID=A0A7W7YBC4_9BACT|nr:RNA-binding protein [Prosthecobacter vanneervenii]MBB5032862.1 RNA recognition motif-containing protein [Prosthecobacter vanneervenii]
MNLYVSNLPYTMTDEELQGEFAAFGNVSSARVVRDRDTGRSRGFAFVEMPVESEALTAINALNAKEIGGRALRVVEARPKEERPQRPFGGGGGGGGHRNQGGGGGAGGRRDSRSDWDRNKRS